MWRKKEEKPCYEKNKSMYEEIDAVLKEKVITVLEKRWKCTEKRRKYRLTTGKYCECNLKMRKMIFVMLQEKRKCYVIVINDHNGTENKA